MRSTTRLRSRAFGVPATIAALAAALACAGPAAAAPSASLGGGPSISEAAAISRVERFWTPQRMAAAVPLDYVSDGSGRPFLQPGAPEAAGGASASYAQVATPEVPPYSVEGRIFVKQGRLKGYCSGTAINTATRQLVLTAGHCVNSGPRREGPPVASNFLEFVPAYDGGVAPLGAFVSQRQTIRALPQWINHGNPDFDMGAFLTNPNSEGVNVADAVGGGASIVLDQSRHQTFKTFGYPGQKTHMEGCESPYVGDDASTYPFPGPPTLAVKCRWAPGASGGGWLIGDGSQINGINTYLLLRDKSRTFGPYFTEETVGKLVRGY
jgi:V8-like Glu-specific endopeptidase